MRLPCCGAAQIIKQQIAEGTEKRRIGLISKGPPARQHSEIKNEAGETVGEITSGAYSPTLKKNVAMGYVTKGHRKAGTKLKARPSHSLPRPPPLRTASPCTLAHTAAAW